MASLPPDAVVPPVPPGPSGPSGSTNTHVGGKRTMKDYPITEETLDMIGTLRNSATAGFSVGSVALGFTLSTWQSLSFADATTPATTIATWTAYWWAGFIVAAMGYLAGGFYICKGGSVLARIKRETTHD